MDGGVWSRKMGVVQPGGRSGKGWQTRLWSRRAFGETPSKALHHLWLLSPSCWTSPWPWTPVTSWAACSLQRGLYFMHERTASPLPSCSRPSATPYIRHWGSKGRHHPSMLMGLQPQWDAAAKMVLSTDKPPPKTGSSSSISNINSLALAESTDPLVLMSNKSNRPMAHLSLSWGWV